MSDRYANANHNVYDPIEEIVSLTSLAADYTPPATLGPSRAIYIEGSGSLVITDNKGVDHTFAALSQGIWHPMRVSIVQSSTTVAATSIKLGW